ncbi:MAG TPA: hypothetical protein VHE55_02380 [Fimbriimonadaceae bacterium]|nr:hypothetical protein [Fimbriimonadaceae bacterium]
MNATAPAINPCWQMRRLVHRLAEGSLAGILLKYTTYHVKHCTRCRQAVEILRATLARLKRLKEKAPELPEDRWASIEAAWMEHEQTDPPE